MSLIFINIINNGNILYFIYFLYYILHNFLFFFIIFFIGRIIDAYSDSLRQ